MSSPVSVPFPKKKISTRRFVLITLAIFVPMGRSRHDEEVEARTKRREELKRKMVHAKANAPQRLTCEFLYIQAKKARLWVYDPQVKRWFTPEEFYTMYSKYANDQFYVRMQLRDPFDAIDAAHLQLEDLNNRLLQFTKKLFEYYGSHGEEQSKV